MPESGDIWIHKRTGNRYFIMRLIKRRKPIITIIQSPDLDKWSIGVLYCADVDDIHSAQWYERQINDFLTAFEKED